MGKLVDQIFFFFFFFCLLESTGKAGKGDLKWDKTMEELLEQREVLCPLQFCFSQEGLGQSSVTGAFPGFDPGSEARVNLRGFSECPGREMSW